jgi:hypothetical protein
MGLEKRETLLTDEQEKTDGGSLSSLSVSRVKASEGDEHGDTLSESTDQEELSASDSLDEAE